MRNPQDATNSHLVAIMWVVGFALCAIAFLGWWLSAPIITLPH
jgi:hypothetical protein